MNQTSGTNDAPPVGKLPADHFTRLAETPFPLTVDFKLLPAGLPLGFGPARPEI